MPTLDVVPLYLAERRPLVERLVDALEQTFAVDARPRALWFEPEAAFDPSRGQYNSTILLRQLLTDPLDAESRVLGVTEVDLFIPVLTYVFGEAQLDGRAAVVSIHRLRPELYGLPANEDLLFDRLEKEAVHELGHAFGLVHCTSPDCVMHASTYVEEIDIKSAHFCSSCQRAIDDVRRRRTATRS